MFPFISPLEVEFWKICSYRLRMSYKECMFQVFAISGLGCALTPFVIQDKALCIYIINPLEVDFEIILSYWMLMSYKTLNLH